ncbi:MAG: MFS transporter [Anaerolineae bacterium]|nr:MFS transporter [Anaerolineae bacterium]
MFQSINRNNRLFMLANFLFALSYGLWMHLRQLHLGDLGATPVEVGAILGVISMAGGVLPIPAGLLTDRIGPKRVIFASWLIAALGTLIAALATTWPVAGLGFAVFMLVIAANPATVAYVLLNTQDQPVEGEAERVMATVFASWPAAMVFAPALGGLIADRLGIGADLWIGVGGFIVSLLLLTRMEDVRPSAAQAQTDWRGILRSRRYLALAVFYPLAVVALYIGYALIPTYLDGVRGFSIGVIGTLFSVMSLGSLAANYVVGKLRPRLSFIVLIGVVWLGTLLIWQTGNAVLVSLAFAFLGAISSMWLLAQAAVGQVIAPTQRGLALGITETLAYVAIAGASWLAGQLYERTPTHEFPFIVGLGAMGIVLALWLVPSIGGLLSASDAAPSQEMDEAPARG